SGATMLAPGWEPSVEPEIVAPLPFVMMRSPLGPLFTFCSYAFCSSGVGRWLLSRPGEKEMPDDGTGLTPGITESGTDVVPIVPSGVNRCATALQRKTMIPPTMAAMMILISTPRFCSFGSHVHQDSNCPDRWSNRTD